MAPDHGKKNCADIRTTRDIVARHGKSRNELPLSWVFLVMACRLTGEGPRCATVAGLDGLCEESSVYH